MTTDANRSVPPTDPATAAGSRYRFGWRDLLLMGLLIALCVSMYVPGLADRGPWTAGEARAVLTPRVMLERDEFVAMRMPYKELEITDDQGVPIIDDSIRGRALADQLVDHVPVDNAGRLQPKSYELKRRITIHKPVGYYWLIAGLGKLGVPMNLMTARLTSALSALGTVLLVYLLGSMMFSRRAGLIAAAALATSVHFIWIARVAKLDMVLTFLLTAIFLLFYIAIKTRHHFWTSLGMYVLLAAAVLLKGPGYLGVPVLVMLLYVGVDWLFVDRSEGLFRRYWNAMRKLYVGPGVLVFLGLAVPWYVMIHVETGGQWSDVMFLRHHLSRFGLYEYGKEFEEKTSWWYYLWTMWPMLFPWIIFLPGALVEAFRKRSRHLLGHNLFLLVWFVFMLVFFSMMSFRKDEYLMPAYPAIMLLVGMMLDRYLTARAGAKQAGRADSDVHLHRAIGGAYVFIAVGALVVLAFAFLLTWKGAIGFYERYDDNKNSLTHMRAVQQFVSEQGWVLFAVGGALMALVGGALWAHFRRRGQLALALLAVGAGVVTVTSIRVLMDRIDDYRSQRVFAERITELADPAGVSAGEPGDPIVLLGYEDHELVYWLDELGRRRYGNRQAWQTYLFWPIPHPGVASDPQRLDVMVGQFLDWKYSLGSDVYIVCTQRDLDRRRWMEAGIFEKVVAPDDPALGAAYTDHRARLVLLRFAPPSDGVPAGVAGRIPATRPDSE